jgi:hypothetical protein
MAAKNIAWPMIKDVGNAAKFWFNEARGKGPDTSAILGAAPEALGQAGGMMIGGKAIEGGARTGINYDALRKSMDLTGKLVKNVDRGANISQGLLGVYQGKVVPLLAQAVEKVKAPMTAAYEQYKAIAAAAGEPDVAPTAMHTRMDKFIDDHPGVSDEARNFYDKNLVRPGPQSIESLNRIKSEVMRAKNAAERANRGIDSKFFGEVYQGINDSMKEHADAVGASAVYKDAISHAKAYFDLKHGVVQDILDDPAPRQGEHLTHFNELFGKDGVVYKSVRDQLNDRQLKSNYGLGDIADQFERNMNYAQELYKGLASHARGFQGLFRSASEHPMASIAAYEALRSTPWLVRLFGVSKVANMLNSLEAGTALRAVRGELSGNPMAFQEGYARGTPPRTFTTPAPPSGSPAAPDMPKGPVTPEERAQWGKSARNAKPVGADVARSSGTFGTTEEMTQGLAKALGDERPEAKKAFAAREARKMHKRVAKD